MKKTVAVLKSQEYEEQILCGEMKENNMQGNIGHRIEQVRRFGPGDSDSTGKEERT